MKRFLPLLVVAILASLSTITIQRWWEPAQVVVVNSEDGEIPAKWAADPAASKSAPEGFVEIARNVTPAVVNVRASASADTRGSNGSGVIISPDGYIVTCFHVIRGANQVVIGFDNKEERIARVIGVDPTTDLALLKVDAEDLDVIPPGNSEEVKVGEWALAVGNPFNLSSTVTAGIVSAKGRNINLINNRFGIEAFIQTDAAVNPGNSGGALINTKGRLIGINSAIMSETGSYEGYSFAIPVNLVMKVIADLRDYGEVQRAVLGIGIREIDAVFARQQNLSTLRGVYITEVYPNSSAEDAGLTIGDVITEVNDQPVQSISQLQEKLAILRPGDAVDLAIMRGSKKIRSKEVRLKKLEY